MITEVETNAPEPTAETPPTPRLPPVANEYASPVFMKRSRASYGPLFELFDQELEEDGGRRGKGRKRPRYSVERGRWRYREESSSPEPEATPEPSPTAEQAKGNASVQDSPPKPEMADGACQTNDYDLPPAPPSSSFNTPFKRWEHTENSPLLGMGTAHAVGGPKMDMGIQASPSVPKPPVLDEQKDATPAPETRNSLSMAASYPNLFGTPQRTNHSFGNADSPFTTVQTPTPAFSQPTQVGTAFGSGSRPSVGFRFGQPPPQPTPSAPSFAESQDHGRPFEDHPYPESYLPPDEPAGHVPAVPHNPFSTVATSNPYAHQGIDSAPALNTQESHTSYWTTAASTDPNSQSPQLDPAEDGHSDESMGEDTPQGTIPPHVEDGTRNRDEMEQDGLLSRPVYRQGVPGEALPDQEDASVGGEDESMDSDERADYDAEEKGDDYDLRNYDRVSDDEEGYDDDQEPLTEEELLDGDEEQYGDEEEDYEEDDYDDEDEYGRPNVGLKAPRGYSAQQPNPAARPEGPKEPVVIDLLSDSDDDEPPAPQPPRSQFRQPPPANVFKTQPIKDSTNHPAQKEPPLSTSEPEQGSSEDEQEPESEEDAVADGLDGQVEEEDAEEDAEEEFDEDEDAIGEDGEEPGGLADESENDDAAEAVVSVQRTQLTVTTTSLTVTGEDIVAASSPAQSAHSNESDEVVDVNESHAIEQKGHITMEQTVVEEQYESVVESFQTQPAEMLASFETQATQAAQSSELGLEDAKDAVDEDEAQADEVEEDKARENKPPDEEMREDAPVEDAPEVATVQNTNREADIHAEVDNERPDLRHDVTMETEEPADDTTLQQPAEEMELDAKDSADDVLEPENARSAEGQTSPDRSLADASHEGQVAPLATSTSRLDGSHAVAQVESSTATTITTRDQLETQTSDTQQITFETQDTELVLSQPATPEKYSTGDAEEEDTEMLDTVPSPEPEADAAEAYDAPTSSKEDAGMVGPEAPLEGEDDAEKSDEALPSPSRAEEAIDAEASPHDEDVLEELVDAPSTPHKVEKDAESGDADVKDVNSKSPPLEEDDVKNADPDTNSQTSPPHQTKEQDRPTVPTRESTPPQIDGTYSDEDDEFHEVSELPEAEALSPTIPYDENSSFMTANSEASEMPDSEGAEPTSTAKRKRGGRHARNDLGINFKRSRPASSDLSPSHQRTTRSKAMTFQKSSSPKNGKEDMSIQLARAAMKTPTKRKTSTKSNNRPKTTLIKRLADEMPECVPLRDLKKYNNRTLDVAVVAASALTPPKRTPVREYVSSLAVTDPSLAPDSVVEVTIFSLHREHFPVVKAGDSVLLRSFTVQAIPAKGWGLKSDSSLSSWAVFEAGGDDKTPQMRAAPVELTDEEATYLVDLRGWYASLDAGAKGKVGKAVGELVDKGREARGEK